MSRRRGQAALYLATKRRYAVVPAALLLVLFGFQAGHGEPPAGSLRFRRVFVPKEQLDGHVRGLLPLKRDEFDKRVQGSAAAADPKHAPAQLRIDEAQYEGRVVGNQIIGGTGELSISSASDGSALLKLTPWNLALSAAVWRGDTDQPAVLGLGDDGKLACLVEQSGRLQVSWTLRGRPGEPGETIFEFQVPAAPLSRLRLTAPADCVLLAEPGIVSPDSAAAQPGERSWMVELGGLGLTKVRVRKQSPASAAPPLVLVREAVNYSVQPATIDVETALELAVLQQSLKEVALIFDEAIQPTSIRLGSHQLDWSPLPVASGQRRILVELPEPLVGEGHTLQVSGVAVWSGQRGWRLPRVRLADGTWQDGRATLTAPAAQRLTAAPVHGCRQTAFSPGSSARSIDQFQFQFYLPDAALEISPSAAAAALDELSGTHLQFDATQVTGVCIAELTAASGERFEIEALVPQRWVVDSVDVQPADFLEDRSVTPRGPGLQTLRLALRRPLVAGRVLRVMVKAHRRRPPAGQALADDVLRLVEFGQVRQARRLVSLANLDPAVHLHLAEEEGLLRLDPASLASDQARLFETLPGPILFEDRRTGDGPRVLIEPTTPQFQAETLVQAFVEGNRIRQRIRLRCEPEASSIDRIQVRLSPPPGPVSWQLVGDDGRGLAVRPVAAAELSSTEETVFELSLSQPRSSAFEIFGELSLPLTAGQSVVLASLPAASMQTGTIEVHSEDGRPLTIAGEQVRPLPPPAGERETLGTLRGKYAYDPGRRALVRVTLQVPSLGQSLAWVDSLLLTSRFSADGSGDHEATLKLTSTGRSQFVMHLPKEAIGVRGAIDGQTEFAALARTTAGGYVAVLPADRRQVVVRIQYASDPPPASWLPWLSIAAPLPQPDLPVLVSRWQVELAPELRPQDDLGRSATLAPTGAVVGDDPPASGWSRHELSFPSGAIGRIAAYRPAPLWAWTWCLGLASAALTYRLLTDRPALLVLLAAAAVSLAVFAPQPLLPLAAGIAVGVAAGGAALVLRPRSRVPLGYSLSSHGSTVAMAGPVGAAIIIAGMWVANVANGASPDGPAAKEAAPARRVVIPVDDRGQPDGDYVYLEPELYDALLNGTGASAQAPQDWLIGSAQYRLAGPPRGDGPRRSVDELIARFDLETFRPGVVVPLALQRAQIHLLEGRALLDGEPVRLDWSPDGRQLRVPVENAGRHRLELALGAAATAGDDGVTLDLEIPPIASSRLVLGAAGEGVSVESALGAWSPGTAEGETVWQLGPAPRLLVRWPANAVSLNPAARTEAEQLVLWRVRPGSVVADAKFRIRPVGGQVDQVSIQVDPRLRLLPPAASEPVARHWLVEGTPANTLHLALREPATAETTLHLSFLWGGSAGVGNLVLPSIAIRADEVTKSWSSVSLASGLELATPPTAQAGVPSLAEFTAAWGEALDQGATFFDAKPGNLLQFAVRPTKSPVQAEQTLAVSFASRLVVVHFRADLTGLASDGFQHRLTVAPELQIEQLTVLEGAQPVASRWTQEPDGSVTIVLSQPPAAAQRLELTARQTLPAGTPRAVTPLVRYLGSSGGSYRLQIFRQADALVALQPAPAAWKPIAESGLGEFQVNLGRLVATLEQAAGQNPRGPQVTLGPNRPQTTGKLVIRVERGAAGWIAVADCQLDVSGGQLDVLRLHTPPSWTGPLEITPAVEYRLESIPGETGRHLLIRPQRAISGPFRLSLRGPLKGGGGDLVAAPDLKLVDAPQVERVVVLPSHLGPGRLDWETSGLQAADTAALALPAELVPTGYELFQAVASRFSASARLRDRPVGGPVVMLADYEVQFDAGSAFVGRSRLDVSPGGARQVTLELPPEQQLVDVAVEGLPAQLTRVGSRRWLVGLTAEYLPQRIEIVARAMTPANRNADGTAVLAGPRMVGAKVERTLWTVRGAGGQTANSPAAGGVTLPHQQTTRLAALATVLESLADLPVANLPASAVAESWIAWQWRFDDARTQLSTHELAAQAGLADRVWEAQSDAAAVRNQLLSSGIISEDDGPAPAVAIMDASATNEGNRPSCYEFKGKAESLQVGAPSTLSNDSDRRLAWLGIGLGVGLVFWRLAVSRSVRDWCVEHGPLLVGLAGLAWVALAPWGWLGWIAVFAAVWLVIRSPWPQRSAEPLSSVVRRSALLR